MNDPPTYFITWTTYGTWLPGDLRGWRKTNAGEQSPQPRLADWSRRRMTGELVVLDPEQRARVEEICIHHAALRGWALHAISARSNHVHVVVSADAPPDKVRDQLEANATRVLRASPNAVSTTRVWTRGGDTQVIDGDLEAVIAYITEAQDRKDRGNWETG